MGAHAGWFGIKAGRRFAVPQKEGGLSFLGGITSWGGTPPEGAGAQSIIHRSFPSKSLQEVPSEDATVVSNYATAFVSGLQGKGGVDPGHLLTAATLKHFVAYDLEVRQRARAEQGRSVLLGASCA